MCLDEENDLALEVQKVIEGKKRKRRALGGGLQSDSSHWL